MTQHERKQRVKEELNRRFVESRRVTAAMAERQIYLERLPEGDLSEGAFAVRMASAWHLQTGEPPPGMVMTLAVFGDEAEAEDYLRRARHILEFGLRCARFSGRRLAREGG